MKKLYLFILALGFCLPTFCQVRVKTDDGKTIELSLDGTWKFVEGNQSGNSRNASQTNPEPVAANNSSNSSNQLGIPEPEFSGMVEFVDKEGKKTIPLESARSNTKGGASAGRILTGIGKIKVKVSVDGKTSTLVLKKSSSLQFIARNENNTENPQKVIQLIKFNQSGNKRQAEIASVGTFGNTSSGLEGYMDFQAKKYGSSSYLISVINLESGEYGFSIGTTQSNILYMFTVEN